MEKVELVKIKKAMKKLPEHIRVKLLKWADDVEKFGLATIKKVPGYHDETLKGNWSGYRSIRLSRGYRAIYFENKKDKTTTIVEVVEANKHEY